MNTKNFFTLALTIITVEAALVISADAKSVPQEIEETIVLVVETVLVGVPIDFSYNESYPDSSDSFYSVPGCPKSDVGYPWVYFGSPPKCYLAGTQGPCDGNQKLFVKSDSEFGFCSCGCIEGIQLINPLEHQFCKPHSAGTLELVHVGDMEKCFTIYEQGPCGEDEWIVKAAETDTTKKTNCEKRTCPTDHMPYESDDEKQRCRPHFVPTTLIYGSSFSSIVPNKKTCESEGLHYSEHRKLCVPPAKSFVSK